jgi:hypothetical protein
MIPTQRVRVQKGGRGGRRRNPTIETTRGKEKSKAPAVFGFQSVPRENWERAFGKFDPQKFRRAVAEQNQRKKEELSQVRDGSKAAPAILGDNKGPGRRLYRGFDFGLGKVIHGRSDRRESMKAQGLVEAG